jgi:hypothetical protein
MSNESHLLLLLLLLATAGCGESTAPTDERGTITVHVATKGSALDPDGYIVLLDDSTLNHVGIHDSLTLSDVLTGQHTLVLGGLAPTCEVPLSNALGVTVTRGQSAIARFDVICQPPGAVTVKVSTTGILPDSDGYALTLNGMGSQIVDLPESGAITVSGLRPGIWHLGLAGVASNCDWTASPTEVQIDSAATSSLQIDVQCYPPGTAGQIYVAVITYPINVPPPASYLVILDGNPGISIRPQGSLTLHDIPVGDHQVKLGGVPSYCGFWGTPSSQTVSVSSGSTGAVRFQVLCLP